MKTDTTRPRHLAVALLVTAVLAAAGCEPSGERQLTIVLVEYKGPEAAPSARRLADELSAQDLPDVFTVEGHEHASVCVGRYDSWKDPQADAMLKRVRVIRDAQGQYPFAGVMLVPMPEPLPEDPWPLEGADGFYTLLVASWEAPGRMANAQRYASGLRSRGYEAYVYHGPRVSTVSIGAFGPEVFDDPGKVGRPGEKPKIVDARVTGLMARFRYMRLEGEQTPPEAHVRTYLGRIPGRETPASHVMPRPKVLYRVTISLVDTKTGLAEGRMRASGVAQGRQQLPTLVGVLVKQLMAGLEQGKVVRVGVVGVLADSASAKAGVDATALQALRVALRVAGAGKIRLFSQEGTRQMLDAAGHKAEDVLRDPRPVKGFDALDVLVVGTVKAFY